jgi:hypothetical protein
LPREISPGRVVRGAATVAKAASGARKASIVAKSSRQAGDYIVSGKNANKVIPNVGKADAKYRYGKNMDISDNVSIKNAKGSSTQVHLTTQKQFIKILRYQLLN